MVRTFRGTGELSPGLCLPFATACDGPGIVQFRVVATADDCSSSGMFEGRFYEASSCEIDHYGFLSGLPDDSDAGCVPMRGWLSDETTAWGPGREPRSKPHADAWLSDRGELVSTADGTLVVRATASDGGAEQQDGHPYVAVLKVRPVGGQGIPCWNSAVTSIEVTGVGFYG